MRSEKEKMLAGEPYDARDPALADERTRASRLCRRLAGVDPGDHAARFALLAELFGAETDADIQPPFHCDYGYNVVLGRNVYINVDCVFLDVNPIRIGDNVLVGPGVHIYAASHPLRATERSLGLEFGAPVAIETDVWIGGGAIVCPGTTVGRGSVVGAGSVVTRSIPEGVFAAGNPCRVLREIDPCAFPVAGRR